MTSMAVDAPPSGKSVMDRAPNVRRLRFAARFPENEAEDLCSDRIATGDRVRIDIQGH